MTIQADPCVAEAGKESLPPDPPCSMTLNVEDQEQNVKPLEQVGRGSSMRMDYQKIGQMLRTAREKKGLTLRDVAAKTDLSYSMISMMENGKAGDLKIGTLEKVLRTYGAVLGLEVIEDASPGKISLPTGLERESSRILQLLPDAMPEDVDVVIRWLERSAAHKIQAAS